MKRKNAISIATVFALFFDKLFRCEARSSRGYLKNELTCNQSSLSNEKHHRRLYLEQYP